MADTRARERFVPYPYNRVGGTFDDPAVVRHAIEALAKAGFRPEDIGVLHGEEGLHRLDLTGTEHGVLAQIQRTLVRTLAPVEEYQHLRHHVDDVRAGRFVIMVLAHDATRRAVAQDVLSAHGADFIVFYGRWSMETLRKARGTAPGTGSVDQTAATTYETEIDGTDVHVRMTSASSAAVSDPSTDSAQSVAAHVAQVGGGLLMLSWQNTDRTTVVQVQDVANHRAYTTLTLPDGRQRFFEGELRQTT